MKASLSLPALSLAILTSLAGCAPAEDRAPTGIAGSTGGSTECAHTAPRGLALELDGVRQVRFAVGPHTLRIDAAANGNGQLDGRACASRAELLADLQVSQQRQGDTLVVTLSQAKSTSINWGIGKGRYAWLDMGVTLPAGLPVEVGVASGDVIARNLPSLVANVASGDLEAEAIAGAVQLKLASGDAELRQIGSLDAAVASGDLEVRKASGAVALTVASGDVELQDTGAITVSRLASGDVEILGVQGGLAIGTIGSGEVKARNINGAVSIDTIGSGEITLQQVAGPVTIDTIGSGDITVDGAASLRVRRMASGDVRHQNIAGSVSLPRQP